MKENRKKQKGITLIALVITIIVLIILSAVGIAMLTGDNGVLENARWSKEAEEFGAVDDASKLYINEKHLNEYGSRQEKVIAKVAQTTDNLPIVQEKGTAVKEEEKCPVTNKQLKAEGENGEKGMEETLKETIRFLEGVDDVNNEEKVKLMYIDREKLRSYLGKKADDVEEDEYVLNVISKNLYWTKGHKHKGKIYHTLRYGVASSSSSKEDEEKPESTYKIHYLSGNGKEETQDISNNSRTIKLKSIEELGFEQEGKAFIYWKEKQEENKEEGRDEEGDGEIFQKKTEGYYGVANELKDILGDTWEEEIVRAVEEDGADSKQNIIEFLGEDTETIKSKLTGELTFDGLVDWMMINTEYLTQLQEYEEPGDTEELEEDIEDIEEEGEEEILTIYRDADEIEILEEGDIYIEAVWGDQVILNANGGKIEEKDSKTIGVTEGEAYGSQLEALPTRPGYVFKGWYTAKEEGIQKTPRDNYVKEDLKEDKLYAQWVEESVADTVSITFDPNEGNCNASSWRYIKGTKIGRLPTATRDKYAFLGWYTQKDGGDPIYTNTVITTNMTVYAHWTWTDVRIKFDIQGGEWRNNTSFYQKYYEAQIGMINRAFPWYDIYGIDRLNSMGEVASTRYVIRSEKWYERAQEKYASLWFVDWLGGKVNMKMPCTWKANNSKWWFYAMKPRTEVLTLNNKNYSLYKFGGWYTEPKGYGERISKGKYIVQDFCETTKSNGKPVVDLTKQISFDEISRYQNDQGLPNIYETGEFTAYAYWKQRYTITYDANGGGFGRNKDRTKTKPIWESQESGTYPKVTKPTKEGYTFVGWYDGPGEDAIEIKVGSKGYMIDGDKTLYAHWIDSEKPEPFTVSVSNLTSSGFAIGISKIEDKGSGVGDVKYYVNTSTSGGSYQSGNTVTGLSGGTRYVWAEITDNAGNTRKSTNYVAVTKHVHTSSCYEDLKVHYKFAYNGTDYDTVGGFECGRGCYKDTNKSMGQIAKYSYTWNGILCQSWCQLGDHASQWEMLGNWTSTEKKVYPKYCKQCGKLGETQTNTNTSVKLECLHHERGVLTCKRSTTIPTSTSYNF